MPAGLGLHVGDALAFDCLGDDAGRPLARVSALTRRSSSVSGRDVVAVDGVDLPAEGAPFLVERLDRRSRRRPCRRAGSRCGRRWRSACEPCGARHDMAASHTWPSCISPSPSSTKTSIALAGQALRRAPCRRRRRAHGRWSPSRNRRRAPCACRDDRPAGCRAACSHRARPSGKKPRSARIGNRPTAAWPLPMRKRSRSGHFGSPRRSVMTS